MRKLTPEERAAKKAAAGAAEHVHDENCGHFVDTVAPVAAKAEKPKKKKTEEPKVEEVKAEAAPAVEEAPKVVEATKAEEAAEAPKAEETPDPF